MCPREIIGPETRSGSKLQSLSFLVTASSFPECEHEQQTGRKGFSQVEVHKDNSIVPNDLLVGRNLES